MARLYEKGGMQILDGQMAHFNPKSNKKMGQLHALSYFNYPRQDDIMFILSFLLLLVLVMLVVVLFLVVVLRVVLCLIIVILMLIVV
jgi:hypothetical protein